MYFIFSIGGGAKNLISLYRNGIVRDICRRTLAHTDRQTYTIKIKQPMDTLVILRSGLNWILVGVLVGDECCSVG